MKGKMMEMMKRKKMEMKEDDVSFFCIVSRTGRLWEGKRGERTDQKCVRVGLDGPDAVRTTDWTAERERRGGAKGKFCGKRKGPRAVWFEWRSTNTKARNKRKKKRKKDGPWRLAGPNVRGQKISNETIG